MKETVWSVVRSVWMALVILVLLPPAAIAHELRPAIATIEAAEDGALAVTISLNLEAAIAGIGAGHKDTSDSPQAGIYDRLRSLGPEALRSAFDRFAPQFQRHISLRTDAGRVPLEVRSVRIPEAGDMALPRISEVELAGKSPAGSKNLYWRVDPVLGNSAVRLRERATSRIIASEYVLAGGESGALSLSGIQHRGWTAVFGRYLTVGFTHILPKGLDHILFVVGLFLLSTRLNALLWQVTAFTVAHTMTLGLAMADIVRLSPAVVEPLIAASIIYVAVENMLTDRLHRWRPVVVFLFGLLHGLGFAGVLKEIGPAPGQFVASLLAFNIGVELGQLSVIALCFLAVGWTMNRTWHRRAVVVPASLAIAVIAGYWVVERTAII